jgi:hypothetical protein
MADELPPVPEVHPAISATPATATAITIRVRIIRFLAISSSFHVVMYVIIDIGECRAFK